MHTNAVVQCSVLDNVCTACSTVNSNVNYVASLLSKNISLYYMLCMLICISSNAGTVRFDPI